jgi:hypothetical protein
MATHPLRKCVYYWIEVQWRTKSNLFQSFPCALKLHIKLSAGKTGEVHPSGVEKTCRIRV